MIVSWAFYWVNNSKIVGEYRPPQLSVFFCPFTFDPTRPLFAFVVFVRPSICSSLSSKIGATVNIKFSKLVFLIVCFFKNQLWLLSTGFCSLLVLNLHYLSHAFSMVFSNKDKNREERICGINPPNEDIHLVLKINKVMAFISIWTQREITSITKLCLK